jgi:hypothetical protein
LAKSLPNRAPMGMMKRKMNQDLPLEIEEIINSNEKSRK